MVTVIKTGHSIHRVFNYNENKVRIGVAECIGAGNYLVDHDKMSLTMKMNRLLKQLELNENVTRNSIHISLNFDPSETNYRLIGAFAPFLLVFNQLIKNCYKVMCYTGFAG
jgi:hypothetical protein